ncbi:MAG: nuclear transport factor 2 family protein [Candidatus Bathyarchaeota archaeon]|nr:nuclear transport factor 2 family protein [Candidatus Bathyarchaeota archaeon]
MSEEKIKSIVNGFGEAFVKRDVEKMLSFFAEDAVWVSPVGTFKGKEELRRVLTWDTQICPIVKAKRSGIELMVKENKAVTEGISEGLVEGKKYEILTVTVFEFNGDKIQQIRLFYDKLSIIKQVTMQYKGVTGWFAKRLVNYIVGRGEKGLR